MNIFFLNWSYIIIFLCFETEVKISNIFTGGYSWGSNSTVKHPSYCRFCRDPFLTNIHTNLFYLQSNVTICIRRNHKLSFLWPNMASTWDILYFSIHSFIILFGFPSIAYRFITFFVHLASIFQGLNKGNKTTIMNV